MKFVNVGEIVKDSLGYPFSDWKKFLIFGVIVLMGILFVQFARLSGYLALVILVLGFLIQIFEYGYLFRIIKSSLNGLMEPPEFNNWSDMFRDGIKIFIILFVYLIPPFMIIKFTEIFLIPYPGIIIAVIYVIIMLPFIALEVVQMADHNIGSKDMFKFREMLNKIGTLGWNRFIKWYLTTGISFLIILAVGYGAVIIVERLTFPLMWTILFFLIVVPYLSMYLSRSVALIFKT